MTIFDTLKELAERTPEPAPLYWVESRPMCARCRWHEVSMPDDLCELCTTETTRGYEALTMTGRCANGAQRDAGQLYHAVKIGEWIAVCGAKHGKRSRWSEYHGKDVTCPRCIKKIK